MQEETLIHSSTLFTGQVLTRDTGTKKEKYLLPRRYLLSMYRGEQEILRQHASLPNPTQLKGKSWLPWAACTKKPSTHTPDFDVMREALCCWRKKWNPTCPRSFTPWSRNCHWEKTETWPRAWILYITNRQGWLPLGEGQKDCALT